MPTGCSLVPWAARWAVSIHPTCGPEFLEKRGLPERKLHEVLYKVPAVASHSLGSLEHVRHNRISNLQPIVFAVMWFLVSQLLLLNGTAAVSRGPKEGREIF